MVYCSSYQMVSLQKPKKIPDYIYYLHLKIFHFVPSLSVY